MFRQINQKLRASRNRAEERGESDEERRTTNHFNFHSSQMKEMQKLANGKEEKAKKAQTYK